MGFMTNLGQLFKKDEWDSSLSIYHNLQRKKLHQDYVAAISREGYESLWKTIPFIPDLELISVNSFAGIKILEKTMGFMVVSAIKHIDRKLKPEINQVVNGGLHCLMKYQPINPTFLVNVQKKFNELFAEEREFITPPLKDEEIVKHLENQNDKLSAELINNKKNILLGCYKLNNCYFLSDYPLAPTSEYFSNIKVKPFGEGFIVTYDFVGKKSRPDFYFSQKKLFEVFAEHNYWTTVMGVNFLANLNETLKSRKIREVIQIAEAFHEKKLSEIAASIMEKYPQRRLILIAGPSSSGKTTFSKRLAIHLKTYGLNSVSLSLDNYFVNRVNTPKDEEGNYDFESIEALDLDLLNQHLMQLLKGDTVHVPEYDFKKGERITKTSALKLEISDVLIVEGIHGLNEMLTCSIPAHMKYKVYVSAITPLNLDPYNRISSSDNRLIRRILRDYKYRGHTAKQSLAMWDSVRKGEEKNIFPFQEEADAMFNSALVYEWVFLKKYVAPLLEKIEKGEPEYSEARRLLGILSVVDSYETEDYIPPTSILREFLGKSSFHY